MIQSGQLARREKEQAAPSRRALSGVSRRHAPQFHIMFVSVNAIAAGCRSRRRESIAAIRHVFLDADHEAQAVLSKVKARGDLPAPS